MAEAIALAASIIAVIQITDRVVGLCKCYIESIRDAPSDLRKILMELTMLKTIFKNLHFLTTSGTVSGLLQELGGKDGPIQGCEGSMTQLEGLFPSGGASVSGQKQAKKRKLNIDEAKKTWATLAWPFKQGKAKMLLEDISRYKATISLALTAEAIHDVSIIKDKASELHETLTTVQRNAIYRWLQSTDPSPIHQRARKCYEPRTGDWMLRSPYWNDWLNVTTRCLWIHGIPGAGKTVLVSELIETIKTHCATSSRASVVGYAYYYCYFGHDQEEAVPFLRWLLNQFCRQADIVPLEVHQLYKQGCEPSIGDLLVALDQILCQYKVVYVAIDAVDESHPRQDLLSVLQRLITDARFSKVQLVASSREYTDIENVMGKISVPVSMNNPSVKRDIRRHVKSIIHRNPNFTHWPPDVLCEVEDAVSNGAKGMFRWAVCQIDALQYLKCDRRAVQHALANLPETLEETYERIFKRISAPDRTFVLHALHWISFHGDLHNRGRGEAPRGIPSSILLQAAIRSKNAVSPTACNRFYNLKRLRELCGCLIRTDVEMIHIRGETYHVSTVVFAHYTVREYIDSKSPFMSALAQGRLMRRELLEVALLSARDNENMPLVIITASPPTSSDIAQALTDSLDIYTVLSAVLALYHWQDALSEWNPLHSIAIALLNPLRPQFDILKIILSRIEAPTDYLLNRAGNCHDLWKASTSQSLTVPSAQTHSGTEAMVMASVLTVLLLTNKEKTVLAKKILQEIAPRNLHNMDLILKKDMMLGKLGYLKTCLFQGSVIELFVQLAVTCKGPLEFLLRHSFEFCDPTRILLLYMEAHLCLHEGGLEPKLYDGDNPNTQTSLISDKCLLSALLQAGADPCAPGYWITPLQIAVVCRDYHAVKHLLQAGADPNAVGDVNGLRWVAGQWMHRFDHFHGQTPLDIMHNLKLEHIEDLLHWRVLQVIGKSKSYSKHRIKIETLLLEHGAKTSI